MAARLVLTHLLRPAMRTGASVAPHASSSFRPAADFEEQLTAHFRENSMKRWTRPVVRRTGYAAAAAVALAATGVFANYVIRQGGRFNNPLSQQLASDADTESPQLAAVMDRVARNVSRGKFSMTGPVGATQPAGQSPTMRFDFHDAPASAILDRLSSTFGISIDGGSGPLPADITMDTPEPLDRDASLKLVRDILVPLGFTLVAGGDSDHWQVLTAGGAKRSEIAVIHEGDPSKIPDTEGLITDVIPLKNADAVALRSNLRPLLSADADVTASNEVVGDHTLTVTDTSARVRRLAEIIKNVGSQPIQTSEIKYRQLKLADASQEANRINNLFGNGTPAEGRGGQASGGGLPQLQEKLYADFDGKTNTVVLNGPHEKVNAAIAELDKEESQKALAKETIQPLDWGKQLASASDDPAVMRQNIDSAEHLIPYSDLMVYPDNWPEITRRREQDEKSNQTAAGGIGGVLAYGDGHVDFAAKSASGPWLKAAVALGGRDDIEKKREQGTENGPAGSAESVASAAGSVPSGGVPPPGREPDEQKDIHALPMLYDGPTLGERRLRGREAVRRRNRARRLVGPPMRTTISRLSPSIKVVLTVLGVRDLLTEANQPRGQVPKVGKIAPGQTPVAAGSSVPPATAPAGQGSTAADSAPAIANQLKIIRNGTIEFEVRSFDDTYDSVARIVQEEGGFVSSTSSDKLANGKVRGAIAVRVPPAHLDRFLLSLRAIGDLKSQQISASDVTKEYTDTDSELRGLRTMESRLLDLIKTGKGEVKDLIEAETKLGETRIEIEKLEGQLKYYDNQVSMATITITAYEKDIQTPTAASEQENVAINVETEEVETEYQAARKILDDAKGRIIESQLKNADGEHIAAHIAAEVPPDKADFVANQLKGLGKVTSFNRDRQQTTTGGTGGPPPGVQVEVKDTRVTVDLFNLANLAPRETTVLRIAVPDVEATYRRALEALRKDAPEGGGAAAVDAPARRMRGKERGRCIRWGISWRRI